MGPTVCLLGEPVAHLACKPRDPRSPAYPNNDVLREETRPLKSADVDAAVRNYPLELAPRQQPVDDVVHVKLHILV